MDQRNLNESSNSSTEPSTQFALASNEHLIRLLQFDEKFISLLHSSIYNQKEINDDTVVQFQINHITDLNQAWSNMIGELSETLINKKVPYDNILKDYFHKLFHLDYLPLLRINRYELTQLSLFGFDIYVPPLTAILEIINRIDGLKHNFQNSINEGQNSNLQFVDKQGDVWVSLQKSWKDYSYFANLWKLSLNFYLLKEYLKIGAKSLVKKDKQIVFTGCNGLFNSLVPLLKTKKEIWLLCECAELANQLYTFHPSYNYSSFYSLLLPLKPQYGPIFAVIKPIAEKCMNAYILTPFLFAILRNYEDFMDFISQADDDVWVPYLNGIAYGILINFKARILEYQEALHLFKKVILKLGVISQMQIQTHLRGELSPEWNEARQFFISALKVGYNFGQLQTWHPVTQEHLQNQILKCVRDSSLMHEELGEEFRAFMPESSYQELLQEELHEISGSKVSYEQFTTNFSDRVVQDIKKKNLSSESKTQILLRISNLVKLSKIDNNPIVISYIFSILGIISFDAEQNQVNIYKKRLQTVIRQFSQKAKSSIMQKNQNLYHLKNILMDKHLNLISTSPSDLFIVFELYLYFGHPKEALHKIFKIIEHLKDTNTPLPDHTTSWLSANILGLYQADQDQEDLVTLKTFNKQYIIPQGVINFNTKMHSCINYLVQKTIFARSQIALQILMKICTYRKWLSIPLLNFPISFVYESDEQHRENLKRSIMFEQNEKNAINKSKLQAFSLWFIRSEKEQHHTNLCRLVEYSVSNSYNEQYKTNHRIKEYVEEVCNITIEEQIVNEINGKFSKLSELEDREIYIEILHQLVLLNKLIKINSSSKKQINLGFARKMLKLYLRIFDGVQTNILAGTSEKSTNGINDHNQKIVHFLLKSLETVYLPALHLIYLDNKDKVCDVRLQVLYMKKICCTSLAPPVQGIQKNIYAYHKDYELPSIKNENSFLINNSIDYMKESMSSKNGEKDFLTEAPTKILQIFQTIKDNSLEIIQEGKSSLVNNIFTADDNLFDLSIDQISEKQLTKEYVLPSLSNDTISAILDALIQNETLLNSVKLIGLNPANHIKLIENCLKKCNENPQAKQHLWKTIENIGITRQIVNYDGKILEAILLAIGHQLSTFTSGLDENAKKILSDSFLISSLMNESDKRAGQFLNLLFKQPQLYFLVVYNQSNWRNLMDWLSKNLNGTQSKQGPILSNNYNNYSGPPISSTILQYLQYIRITKNTNKEYELKIVGYANTVEIYAKLLSLKEKYLSNLESQTKKREDSEFESSKNESMKGSQFSELESLHKDSSISEVSRRTKNTLIIETLISEEQLQLYFVNELANIRLIMESAQYKSVLNRLGFFKKQIRTILSKEEEWQKFRNIEQIFDKKIIDSLGSISSIANRIAKGPAMAPDFMRTYQLCSQKVHRYNKIELGQCLEDYYSQIQEPLPKQLIYHYQFYHQINLDEFLQLYYTQDYDNLHFPEISIKNEQITAPLLKEVQQKYQVLKKYLLDANVICQDNGMIDIINPSQLAEDETENKIAEKLRFFGLLAAYSNDPLSPLLNSMVSRDKLTYQILKPYHPENYHFIKSILIDSDDSLKERDITFTLKGRELIKGGKEVKVNGHNKEIYCNLVGLDSLGGGRVRRGREMVQGRLVREQ